MGVMAEERWGDTRQRSGGAPASLLSKFRLRRYSRNALFCGSPPVEVEIWVECLFMFSSPDQKLSH